MKKRILSLLLCLVMVLSLLPTTAWAAKGDHNKEDHNPGGTTTTDRHAVSLAWNYATITESGNGGFATSRASEPSGATITVKVGNTELTKGGGTNGKYSMPDGINASNNTPVTISVSTGFYIVRVLLCCNDNNGYDCKTSQSKQAFSKIGSVDGTAVTMTLGEIWDHANHTSGMKDPYWLMVMVAPVPQPVYVGYDAGTLNFTGTLVSRDDGTWVSGVDTRKYTTNDGTVSHTVLDITSEAKTAAAAQGLEFDGWKLTYYNNYTENGNAFSNALEQYTNISKSVGNSITLFTHAKLVAQWKTRTTPTTGTLTITKEFAGLTAAVRPASVTFTITGPNNYNKTATLPVDNQWTTTISDLPVGTYTVTETIANNVDGYTLSKIAYEVGNTKNTYEPGKDDTDKNKVAATVTADGTANVTVTNTYTQKTIEIPVEKKWEGTTGITLPESIEVELYKVTRNDDGEEVYTSTNKTLTLTADENQKWLGKFENMPEYDGSTKIAYAVKEVGYTAKGTTVMTEGVPGGFVSVPGNVSNNYTITNTAQWDADDVKPASLTIVKTDADTGKALSGVEFKLYEDGSTRDTVTTDEDGKATFTGLIENLYFLKETKALDGYKESGAHWNVWVVKDENSVRTVLNTDGKWQKVYDCTVTVNDELVSEIGYSITNVKAPDKYTVDLPIEKIVTKTGGNTKPGNETFVFSAYYLTEDGESKSLDTLSIATTGEGTYEDKLALNLFADLFDLEKGTGDFTFYVSEVSGNVAGWKYDKTVYAVTVCVVDYEVTGFEFHDTAEDEPVLTSVDGEEIPEEEEFPALTFTNEFSLTNTPSKPNKPSKPVTSVKTGDAGVAMYALSGLLSLGGAALFMKKRKDEE